MSLNRVNLVVALPAEAKSIAYRYDLKRVQPKGVFPVYRNQHISLVVSGVGKTNAAAASAYLYALNASRENAVWINLGIAGHRDLELGAAILAHRITDAATGRYWRPCLAIQPPCPIETLETVDRPHFRYTRTGAFDMEASGFYATAIRFTRAQLVHCLKVISDNRKNPGHGIDAATVRRLIEGRLDLLDELLSRLSVLGAKPIQ